MRYPLLYGYSRFVDTSQSMGEHMNRISRILVIVAAFACTSMIQCVLGGSGVETVTLHGNCLKFATGEVSNNCSDEFDTIAEPWCAGYAGLCGNWVKTTALTLDDVTTPPASGYISDGLDWVDCQEVAVGDVLVFKLKDGTYAKVLVASVTFDSYNCADAVTLEYVYPM